jgi:uncharacterized protein (TIGR03089 family)
MPPPPTPAALLAAALGADPARPLLTFHDHADGQRVELSVATFANWVAKTANLVRDELDAQPGDVLSVRLPLHWQAAVWLQAGWATGLVVSLDPDATADVTVVSHDDVREGDGSVVSLGLAPMGLPRPDRSPATPGALDYDREIHAHGDRFDGAAPAADAVALVEHGEATTGATLAAEATTAPPPGGALLVTGDLTTRDAVLAGLLVPLASGVTSVLVRHADPEGLGAIVAQERVVAAVGRGPRHVPAWRPGPPG